MTNAVAYIRNVWGKMSENAEMRNESAVRTGHYCARFT